MLLDARRGFRGTVIDLDTGERIPKVITLDTETGIIEAFLCDGDGNEIREIGNDGVIYNKTYKAKGRFEVRENVDPRLVRPPMHIVMGAPACAKCQSPLTLPGDDLCPSCRAADRNQKNKMKVTKIDPLEVRQCCNCSRQAAWQVADEVETTPQIADSQYGPSGPNGKIAFDTAATVGRRFYCDFCYRGPALLDAKGDVISVDEESNGLRPQWHS